LSDVAYTPSPRLPDVAAVAAPDQPRIGLGFNFPKPL
jgi:hypothetical protein